MRRVCCSDLLLSQFITLRFLRPLRLIVWICELGNESGGEAFRHMTLFGVVCFTDDFFLFLFTCTTPTGANWLRPHREPWPGWVPSRRRGCYGCAFCSSQEHQRLEVSSFSCFVHEEKNMWQMNINIWNHLIHKKHVLRMFSLYNDVH